jgi:hypothetical protein
MLYYYILDKICVEWTKINFKIGQLIPQNGENR